MTQQEDERRCPTPGVSRDERISDDGLQRLRKQLSSGVKISPPVLRQWIKRYGDSAKQIMLAHGLELPG